MEHRIRRSTLLLFLLSALFYSNSIGVQSLDGTIHTSVTASAHDNNTISALRYPQMSLDVENYQVGPDELILEQVHVYVRHGERTPVGVRLSDSPASIPEHWNMCQTAPRFHAAVSSVAGAALGHNPSHSTEFKETLPTRILVERKDGTVKEGECFLGELTDLGRQSTFSFGKNLRKLYVERLGFIPDILTNKSAVYFRSTNIPRTTESLQQIIHGLYPSQKCHPDVLPPLLIRNPKDENLIGNTYACQRLQILQRGFATAAARAYNPGLGHLDKRISKYLNGNPVRVDGKPRASGIMDTIRAAIAHGVKVPPEFEDKGIVDVIEEAVVSESFAGIMFPSGYKTEEVRRLGMGRLLADMANKMQHKAENESDALKVLVHSTHDTAIGALCSTLDVYDENWPAFTASITFELFRRRVPESQTSLSQSFFSRLGSSPPPPQHYIRMRYQNENMILPMCAREGDHLDGHPEFCTLTTFKARVEELTPVDWDTECLPTGSA